MNRRAAPEIVRDSMRLRAARGSAENVATGATYSIGRATLVHADCFDWLRVCSPRSIHAVVTDPPYGLLEYSPQEQAKLRIGRGGVWRIPPSFDGHKRSPLPRFTVLDDGDRSELFAFFKKFAELLSRVLVPGANVV